MYNASATFKTKIKDKVRQFHWYADITTVGGQTYSLDDIDNILSGTITRSISSQELSVGTAYAATLTLEFKLAGVSRYELYDGTVTVSVKLEGATDVIPMGIYTISEATQTMDHITVKAYDAMINFDGVSFSASLNNTIQSPYSWLNQMCAVCGVTLGQTSADIEAMPNGRRITGFADSVADVSTWRDVLGYMAAYLGGFAYIGRDGNLYIGHYGSFSVDTIHATFRFSSSLSDFRTTYDGMYAVYKDGGVQEYVSNSNTGGLVLNLGTNPFLQFSDTLNRLDALQEIIDAWDGVYYVPYTAGLPLVPIYDPGDVLTFVDNQADVYDYGALAEITYKIGGPMSVVCPGDNPKLAQAQDRFTKTVAGLGKEYNNGQEVGAKNYWSLQTSNTSAITVGNTKTKVAEIEFKQTTDVQRVCMAFSCSGVLSATATARIEITIDDEATWTFPMVEEKYSCGTRPLVSTCGFRITGKGTHYAKVYLTITDNPLLWSDIK